MPEVESLKWRFDVSTFRLIGRDLITDRITALFELVKNCYDANALKVRVEFNDGGVGNPCSSIIVSDDGYGMSFVDIRDKWMVIGTSSKKKSPISPKPFCRRCVGEKGIGRFAVDKLGDKVQIVTKKAGESQWLNVEINWTDYYSDNFDSQELTLFTDIENKYYYTEANNPQESGTSLIISDIREIWTKNDIRRFMAEIAKIVSPYASLDYPFDVYVKATQYDINQKATRDFSDVNIATKSLFLDFDGQRQQTAEFDERTGDISVTSIPLKSFGGVRMRLYYFDEEARRKYRREFPNNQIDGIKIYRDGIITTPFAENEEDPDKKRDVLGIDKRLWQDIFSRVSTREIVGIVDITRDGNPMIIDATNRQDFVDNQEYHELKEFIILQLSAVQQFKIFSRYKRRKSNANTLERAGESIESFISTIKNISKQNPDLKKHLTPAIEQAKKTGAVVKQVITEQKQAQEEFVRKENIYLSIMSMQEYSIHITHAVRTTLNKIRDKVEYFKLFFPDPKEEDIFRKYALDMYEEFKSLNKVIDYMLSYSQSNLLLEEVDFSQTVHEIFDSYSSVFEQNDIQVEVFVPEKGIILKDTNKVFFRDIFNNMIDNSVKAVKKAATKIIKCTVSVDQDRLRIDLSDTGHGIPLEKRTWVFGIYNTTTEGEGGAGIGLYIVKTRVESLKGSVKIIDSEFGELGTTIRVELPFKR